MNAPDDRQGSLFFQSERNDLQGTGVRMLSPQAAYSTGGRHKSGSADLLKTISIGFAAGGLIFNGLIGPFRLITGYSAITSE